MARRQTKQPETQVSFFDQPPKVLERDTSVASKWDIIEKTGGEVAYSERDWDAPGKMGVLPSGSKFVECNDTFYNIYYPSGEKAHYRVAKKVLHGIINPS